MGAGFRISSQLPPPLGILRRSLTSGTNMNKQELKPREVVPTATRTLLAAGYEVKGCQRHPNHAEIYCERVTTLGALIRFTFAITDTDTFTAEQIAAINRTAGSDGRVYGTSPARWRTLEVGE